MNKNDIILIRGICQGLNSAINTSDKMGGISIIENALIDLALTKEMIKVHCPMEYQSWKELGLFNNE